MQLFGPSGRPSRAPPGVIRSRITVKSKKKPDSGQSNHRAGVSNSQEADMNRRVFFNILFLLVFNFLVLSESGLRYT